MLDDLHSSGHAPWEIWKRPPGVASFGKRQEGAPARDIGAVTSPSMRRAAAADIRS